jgi:hypothetical protein
MYVIGGEEGLFSLSVLQLFSLSPSEPAQMLRRF